jgi:hypothetical protein
MRPGPLAGCLLAAAMAVAAAPGHARAEESRSRVVVVVPPSPGRVLGEAATRLVAELRAAGFDVTQIEGAGPDPRAAVEAARLDPPAVAALALFPSGNAASVDVWVSESLSGKTLVRRVDVQARSGVPRVLAIRATELLRASLLELGSTKAESEPSAAEPAPTPPDVARWLAEDAPPARQPPASAVAPVEARSKPHARLSAGLAMLTGFGGLGPAAGTQLGVGWSGAVLGARLSLVAPTTSITWEVPGGAARASQQVLLAEATMRLGPTHAVVEPTLSAGVGLYRMSGRGTGKASGVGRDDVVTEAALSAGGAISLWLGASTSLGLGARALVLSHPVEVRAQSETLASTGRALALVTLSLRAAF